VLVPRRSGRGVEREIIGSEIANERWMDVGFATGPVQCSEDDGTVSRVSFLPRSFKDSLTFFPSLIFVVCGDGADV